MVVHRSHNRVNVYQKKYNLGLHTESMLELISDWFVASL